MDAKLVKMNKEICGKTCIYWRVGRCNRKPCKFMHAETLSPHTSYPSINVKSKICGKSVIHLIRLFPSPRKLWFKRVKIGMGQML